MLLGLNKIIDNPGASVAFSTSVDLSDLCYGVSYPVTEPVLAEGMVRNTAGVLVMKGDIRTTIHGTCDRCASDFDRDVHIPIDVVLVMTGSITTAIHGICDRCASPFDRDIYFPIDVVLVTEMANEENEDEWVFPLEGDSADLDDIVRTVFVLNLDSKLLCNEDCKGMCHRCGKNLNEGPCNCQKELDPRFAALKQLLEK